MPDNSLRDAQNSGSITRQILNIGVPSFLETLFTTFASMIDSKMVSVMGLTAISAVSVTNQPRLFIFSAFFAIQTVTTSLVAKYYGQANREAANQVFDHVLKIVAVLSIVLGLLAAAFARPILVLFSNQKDTLEDSIIYFRIVMGGMFFNLMYMTINAALRGIGKTKLTFTDNVLSCVVNLTFNYLLIEGHFGFPALGMAGAAIATVLGMAAAFVLSVVFCFHSDLFINIPYCLKKKYKMTLESLKEITDMTKSCAVDNMSMRFSLLLISGITARIGSFQMAIYSVGNYLLNVNFALGSGLQTSAVTLIGRAYGQEDYDLLCRYKKAIEKLGLTAAGVLALVIMVSGRFFFSFFNKDEAFISAGAISAICIGVITLAQTVKFISTGCLQGVGSMREIMLSSLVGFSVVNISLIALTVLVLKWGVWGVWLSTFVSQTAQAGMLQYFIRKNPVFRPDYKKEAAESGK